MEIETLQKSLSGTCAVAADWFLENSNELTQEEWDNDDLDDDELGVVFVFFDDDNDCLFVGSSEGGVKEYVEAQKLDDAEWWDNWDTLELLNTQDETDQAALVLLLTLALEPENSENIDAKDPEDMFAQFED